MELDRVLGACEWYKSYSISVHHAMHAFISARQRTCPARMGFWVSVCGSSGFCTGVRLPTFLYMYVLVTIVMYKYNIQALVLYLYILYIDILPPPSVESHSRPEEVGAVRIIIHHSRAILHQSCSTFHPQPHTHDWAFS